MNQKVSILIPAYNSERWIADTVKSAVHQSWPNKEIIIVDDGSSDNTLSILRQFESSSVNVVSQSNKGACAARNKALSYAQGDYIQWLDADDLLAPDKIYLQMKQADSGNASSTFLTSSFAKFFSYWQCAKFVPNSLWQDLEPTEWLFRKLYYNAWMNPATWLVSRKLTEMSGPWNESLHRDQDGEYVIRIVCNSSLVKFVKEAKSYYRIGNASSISMRNPYKVSKSYLQAGAHSFHVIRSINDSKRIRDACFKSLEHRILDFYPDNQELMKDAKQIAASLSREITTPKLNWRYRPVRFLFGWRSVRRLKRLRLKLRLKFMAILERIRYRYSLCH